MDSADISFVIPVFNGEQSIASVVDRIRATFSNDRRQIVLVNDGSKDASEIICRQVQGSHPNEVLFLQLAKNFGEHHAVLAGLSVASGKVVVVLDDDGQNPPEEVPRMIAHLVEHQLDVVYGKYVDRKHSWDRRLGSWLNDRMAILMLKKPKGIYLSSFKAMSSFLVKEISKYDGPYPYIDGLILRTTDRIGQIEVLHASRIAGHSNYNLRRLIRLWLNMMLGFSILPLRMGVFLGFIASLISVLWLTVILVEKIWINPDLVVGVPSVLASLALFSGVQLMLLGVIGEYVGRTYLANSGMPQYIIRSRMG